MSNLTLYNIANQFTELMDKAENEEITEEEYNAIGEQLALELQNKSTNIVGYIQNESSLIDAIDVQIKRLQDLKKSKQKNLDNFKKYVKDNMEKLNLQRVETEIGTLSIAKNPISIEIVNEDKIPGEFKKIIQEVKVDKTKIKDYFKETGEIVEGVKVLTENTYLKIK